MFILTSSSHLCLYPPSSFFLQFSDKNIVRISHISHAFYVICPSHIP